MIPNRDQLNILVRVVMTALMIYYASTAWSFYTGRLSVAIYGGALASQGFWAVAYGIASFSSLCALLRESIGRLLLLALALNVLVTIMWLVTRTIISIQTNLDYSGSFNALAWLTVLLIVAYVQGLINPFDDGIEHLLTRIIDALHLFRRKEGRVRVVDGHPGTGNADSGLGGISGDSANRTRQQ